MDSQLSKDILSKVQQLEIRTRRLVDQGLAGHYHSVFKGRGMDFDSVREYIRGDEVKNIDWNVTARANTPYVKTFHEERELTIMLMIDVSASGDFGSHEQSKRELAAEIGSILALSATRNNDKVGLLLFTDEVELFIPPRKGRSHILRIIREILFFQPAHQGTDLPKALGFINQVIARKAVTFLISDFCLPAPFEQHMNQLKTKLRLTNKHHDLIAVSITDPREQSLPDVGLITLEDAETGELIEINTSSPTVRENYAKQAEQQHEKIEKMIRLTGVDQLNLFTDKPYMAEIMNFFRTRERRK